MRTLGIILCFALVCPTAFVAALIFWEFTALVLLVSLLGWCSTRFFDRQVNATRETPKQQEF